MIAALRLCCVLMLALAGIAPAQAATQASLPDDVMAYWSFDPSRFEAAENAQAGRAAVLGLLRVALAGGAAEDADDAALLQIVLAAAESGAWPHTLALLDLTSDQANDESFEISNLQMVLDIQATGDHAPLMRSMQAIVLSAAGEGDVVQEAFDLPEGRRGVRCSAPDWPAWRTISWTSSEGSFTIGLGTGALARWLALEPVSNNETGAARWSVHRNTIDTDDDEPFLEAFVDLNRMRQHSPQLFLPGRPQRLLEALGLANARDAMLHGHWVAGAEANTPAFLAFDATWSARSQSPEIIHQKALSESVWPPTGPGFGPPPGSYVIVLRANWTQWIETWLNVAIAVASEERVSRRAQTIFRWTRQHHRRVTRLDASLGEWVVISDVPPPIAPVPGAATVFTEVNNGMSAEGVMKIIASLLSPWADDLRESPGNIRWIQMEPTGLLRAPAWGGASFEGQDVMIAGWGPPCVIEGRAWLNHREAKDDTP